MTDVSYLERMGRELKCPICLSLLNSAVSLTCNHVFCNSCIGKSMKSASECPVCKVPYQRREIRPAPHMDNLVSIYKSMEITSGVNIFVTQPVPSTQLSGGEPPLDGSMICERDENKKNNRGKSKRKTSNLSLKNNSKTSSTNPLKPSFPRKKRVQVQQHPPLETPTRPTKLDGRIIEQTKDKAGDSSLVAKDRNNLNVNGETLFFPFFWLRDQKDTEKSSQRTDEDQVAETPPDAPCFSDMKDSDDDNHYDIAPQSAFHPVSHDPEILDSEMFKWTQRACSPELCCSPMKMQEMDCEVSLQDADSDSLPTVPNGGDKILENGNDELGVSISTVSAHGVKMTNNKSKTKTAKKRASKASGSTQRKRVKTVTDEVCGIPNEIQKGACSSIQANKCDDKGNQMNMKEMHCKRNKKVSFNTLSNEAIIIQVMDQSDRSNLEKGKNVNHNLKLTGQKKGTTDSTVPQVRDKSAKSKSQNPGNSNDGTSQLKTKTFTSQITRKSFLLDDDMKLPSSCQKKKESNVKSLKALNDSEEVKFAADCRSKVKVVNNIQRKVQENSSLGVENDSAEIVKAPARSSAMFLCKCEAASSIPCAFCQCPEDSNVSGVMVHYLKGKPVAADQSGGLGIIHAHRECAEWAPNVYFEDDTAINLETELSRSRRIKCCCCGLKGAALGCYAKSCHRSFHYPCAKLTPQCRWDNENFVMLCPLHAALVLPKEASGSQLKQEKKRMSKRQSHIPQAQVAIIHDNSTASRWNSHGLFKKMVISYSALSSEDKKTVAVFEKLSGVSVLKCWNSSVTHIITSTDENGASRRTLKFLMGILEGKWIINIDWVKACMKAMKPVDEQDYEIDVDIHGVREGPRFGRLRLLNKQPKLFSGLTFYFTGDFVPSYKGYLHDLVIAAGGTVLHRKPVPKDHDAQLTPGRVTSETLLIYSLELPDNCSPSKRKLILSHTQSDAEALARSSGAVAVSNSWILDSIAACKLQNLTE